MKFSCFDSRASQKLQLTSKSVKECVYRQVSVHIICFVCICSLIWDRYLSFATAIITFLQLLSLTCVHSSLCTSCSAVCKIGGYFFSKPFLVDIMWPSRLFRTLMIVWYFLLSFYCVDCILLTTIRVFLVTTRSDCFSYLLLHLRCSPMTPDVFDLIICKNYSFEHKVRPTPGPMYERIFFLQMIISNTLCRIIHAGKILKHVWI